VGARSGDAELSGWSVTGRAIHRHAEMAHFERVPSVKSAINTIDLLDLIS